MIKKELNPECGKRLKQCIEESGMTQKSLGEAANYTQQMISNIIVGKKRLTTDAAKIFSNILHVKSEYLLCF